MCQIGLDISTGPVSLWWSKSNCKNTASLILYNICRLILLPRIMKFGKQLNNTVIQKNTETAHLKLYIKEKNTLLLQMFLSRRPISISSTTKLSRSLNILDTMLMIKTINCAPRLLFLRYNQGTIIVSSELLKVIFCTNSLKNC